MKTAKHWGDLWDDTDIGFEGLVVDIQNDARRAGLEEAAKLIEKMIGGWSGCHFCGAPNSFSEPIRALMEPRS